MERASVKALALALAAALLAPVPPLQAQAPAGGPLLPDVGTPEARVQAGQRALAWLNCLLDDVRAGRRVLVAAPPPFGFLPVDPAGMRIAVDLALASGTIDAAAGARIEQDVAFGALDATSRAVAWRDRLAREAGGDAVASGCARPEVPAGAAEVLAVADGGTATSPTAAGARGTVLPAGRTIPVNFARLPGTNDWIAIAAAGAPDDAWVAWRWSDGSTTPDRPAGAPQREGRIVFDPLPPGSYEVRIYFDWPAGGYRVRGRRPLTIVPAGAEGAPTRASVPVPPDLATPEARIQAAQTVLGWLNCVLADVQAGRRIVVSAPPPLGFLVVDPVQMQLLAGLQVASGAIDPAAARQAQADLVSGSPDALRRAVGLRDRMAARLQPYGLSSTACAVPRAGGERAAAPPAARAATPPAAPPAAPAAVPAAAEPTFGPLPADFPPVWRYQDERGANSVWTRRGLTDVFDEVAENGNRNQHQMKILGNRIRLGERMSPSAGVTCIAEGPLSADRRRIDGTFACTGVTGSARWWMTVEGAGRPPAGIPDARAATPPAAPALACGQNLGAVIDAKWRSLGGEGGLLGCPTSGEIPAGNSPQGTRGTFATFTNARGTIGTIVAMTTGARAGQAYEVHGEIRDVYAVLGGSVSWLGFTVSDEYAVTGGRRNDFEGGYVFLPAGAREARAYRYGEEPAVQAPMPTAAPAFAGTVRTDRGAYAEGEAITVAFEGFPATNDWIAIAPAGAAAESYSEWRWTDGSATPGQPSGATRRDGTLQFAGLAPGDYEVRAFLGWPGGAHTIRARHAFTVRSVAPPPPPLACGRTLGAGMLEKWQALGAEGGFLGCPTSDEMPAGASPQGTTGTWATFTNANGILVRMSSGARAGQAYEVHGDINGLYLSMSGSMSWLGFPVSDQYEVAGGRRSDFEGGYILWSAATREVRAYRHGEAPVEAPPPAPPPSPTFAGALRTDRDAYAEGDAITVVFQNFPGTWDWITVAPAGNAAEQYGEWYWTDGSTNPGQPAGAPLRDGSLRFTGLAPGDYEVRAFSDWPNGGYTVRARHRFTVGPGLAGACDVAGTWNGNIQGHGADQWTFTPLGNDRYSAQENGLGNAGGTATVSGRDLRIDWQTGVWSGTIDLELDPTCTSGTGVNVIRTGTPGTHATTLERAGARAPAAPAAQTEGHVPPPVAAQATSSLGPDFPSLLVAEFGTGWTATWTRRGTSDLFDVVYQGPGGQSVTTVEEFTRQGDRYRIQRRSSTDGILCVLDGATTPDRSAIEGTGTCPGVNAGWWFRLTAGGAAPATEGHVSAVPPRGACGWLDDLDAAAPNDPGRGITDWNAHHDHVASGAGAAGAHSLAASRFAALGRCAPIEVSAALYADASVLIARYGGQYAGWIDGMDRSVAGDPGRGVLNRQAHYDHVIVNRALGDVPRLIETRMVALGGALGGDLYARLYADLSVLVARAAAGS